MINFTFSEKGSDSLSLNNGFISRNIFVLPSVDTSNAKAILDILVKLVRSNVNKSAFEDPIE